MKPLESTIVDRMAGVLEIYQWDRRCAYKLAREVEAIEEDLLRRIGRLEAQLKIACEALRAIDPPNSVGLTDEAKAAFARIEALEK